jgi:ATP-binding cassette subfamily B protein
VSAVRSSLHAWPRALRYAVPHRLLFAAALLFVVLGALASLAEPWPLAILVDSVLGEHPLPGPLERWVPEGSTARIGFVALVGLLVPLSIHGINALGSYVATKLEMRMVLEFRSDLFRHVQRLSLAYHDDRRTGEFLGRINQQAAAVGKVTVAIMPLLQSALTLLGMFVVAFRLNPPVALVAIAVVPFIYLSSGYYGSRIGPQVRDVKRMEIRSIHIVHEAVQMLRVVVAFNGQRVEYEKFRSQGEDAVAARVRLTRRQLVFALCVNLITATGTAAVIGVGAWQVDRGQLTVGELLVFLSYVAAIYAPLQTISSQINTIQEQLISFELASELLASEPDIVDRPGAIALDRAQGRLAFEDVSFTYAGRERTLERITFVAEPGQRVAIVGPTGAGKSTLAGLLPRFYDPEGGRILLDEVDLRDLTLESVRAQMSVVLQEPLLFQDSIRANIRYGRLDATDDEIRAAARAACAHEFIMELPSRYATKLGERGAKLSGGERQRIAVARAFLKDAPILILDEPTSSIDSRSEAIVLEALDRLMRGRTTFLIAHRLSTVASADQILVIDAGRIAEHGTHAELRNAGGLYQTLWEHQTIPDPTEREALPPPASSPPEGSMTARLRAS